MTCKCCKNTGTFAHLYSYWIALQDFELNPSKTPKQNGMHSAALCGIYVDIMVTSAFYHDKDT